MIKQKSMLLSVTFWVNVISFFLLWFSSQTISQSLWGAFAIYGLNLILNLLKNDQPIKTQIQLPISMQAMKILIYIVNGIGLSIQLYTWLVMHSVLNPAVWLTMLISFLTLLIRTLTTPQNVRG